MSATRVTPAGVVGRSGVPGQRAGSGWLGPQDAAQAWALVAAAQAGDREAFGQLYVRYEPRVRAFFRRQVRDHYLVEDLTSETFLRVLRLLDNASDQGVHVIVWIMLNARSVLWHHWDRAHVRREVATEVIPESVADISIQPDPQEEAFARIEREAVGAAVRAGLGQLCASRRHCVELYDLDGHPMAEVTALLGRTEQAVHSMRKRARQQLAEVLDPGGAPGADRYTRATQRAHAEHQAGGRRSRASRPASAGVVVAGEVA